MPHPWADATGVAAAVCSTSSFLPQIAKITRDHDAVAVSFRMYLVMVIGFALWIVYGVSVRSWPVAVSNVVNLGLATTILGLKLRYSGRAG